MLAVHTRTQQESARPEEERMKASMEALAKLKQGCKRLEQVRARMQAQGASTTPVEAALSAQHARMLGIQEMIVSGM